MVFGSPDVFLHLSPFICFSLWLVVCSILTSVVWLCGCLSLHVFLHVSHTLASGVRMSSLFFHLAPIICFLLSVSRFICLPTHLPSIISLPKWWCLILSPVRLCACLPSFNSHHMSPTSLVSPSGGVLFLFCHDFICGWSLSLFFSPFASSCCLRSFTSIDPR